MENLLNQLPRMIDLSCVRGDITFEELDQMVALAKKYQVVCCFAMPYYTPWLIEQLKDEPQIGVGGPVGFPSGADLTETKVDTARRLRKMGCDELDMVINITALKGGRYNLVEDDIKAVIDAGDGCPVKSILEVSYLTDDEILRASEIAAKAGVSYVKTGTGWGKKPTTVDHIRLIRSAVGDKAKIKAAGGVRDLDTIRQMVEAGCSRFGIGVASASRILQEYEQLSK